jgi:hypothetical protein
MVRVLQAMVVIWGGVLIIGAYKRWSWIADPPFWLDPFRNVSRAKARYGEKYLIRFAYVVGSGLVIIGSAQFIWG